MKKVIKDIARWIYHKPQHWFIKSFVFLRSSTLNLKEMDNVVIVAPHPDDEVFGCGGLIKKLTELKRNIFIIFLSKGEGIAKNSRYSQSEIVAARKELAYTALSSLGVSKDKIIFLDFSDGDISRTDDKNIGILKNTLCQLNPQYIFYPHYFDGSPDHEEASEIMSKLSSDIESNKYYYCVWLWHHTSLIKVFRLEFSKCYFLKVNSIAKLKASRIYSEAHTDDGFYYSGKLPYLFLRAVNWNKEIFFKS